MRRGTTPTLEFALPFEVDLIAEAYVTISQNLQVLIQQVVWKFTLLIFHIRARPKGLIFMRKIKESRYIECM